MLKKNKLKMIFIFSFMTWAFSVHAADCGIKTIRYSEDKKVIQKQESVCVLGLKSASSKNCMLPSFPKCPASKIKKTKSYNSFLNEINSPGTNLCEYLEGKAYAYELNISGKWHPFERCRFKNSSEFIEIGELISYYKSL